MEVEVVGLRKLFTVQCHMTSQLKDSGKQIRVTEVWNMESEKDDSPPKSRFLEVRKEIHNR